MKDDLLFAVMMGGTILMSAAVLLALIWIAVAAGADPAVAWAAGAVVAFCTGGMSAID